MVRTANKSGWYFKVGSKTTGVASSLPPTYPTQIGSQFNAKLQYKEFRYLRTVIVTAAVYWDFDQGLSPHQLIFQHRAGITPYTSSFDFAECCVFNKQSQPPIL